MTGQRIRTGATVVRHRGSSLPFADDHGPNRTIAAACASATAAIGEGWRLLRHGYVTAALCGGSDAICSAGFYAGAIRIRQARVATGTYVKLNGAGAFIASAVSAAEKPNLAQRCGQPSILNGYAEGEVYIEVAVGVVERTGIAGIAAGKQRKIPTRDGVNLERAAIADIGEEK